MEQFSNTFLILSCPTRRINEITQYLVTVKPPLVEVDVSTAICEGIRLHGRVQLIYFRFGVYWIVVWR